MIHECQTDEQRALVSLCGLMGLRVSEARAVFPHHFDLLEMTLTVHGKGQKNRVVPVSERAWKYIQPAWQAHPGSSELEYPVVPLISYSDRGARLFLTSLGKKAQLKRAISSHDLRATFATAAYNKSRDLRVVQELLGHASSQTTEIYTGVHLEKMREAADIA